MLSRFVPFTAREPDFRVEPPRNERPLTGSDLRLRGIVGGAIGLAFGAFTVASMEALEAIKEGSGFHILVQLTGLVHPTSAPGWLTLLGLALFSGVCGLLTAAVLAARHGKGLSFEESRPE